MSINTKLKHEGGFFQFSGDVSKDYQIADPSQTLAATKQQKQQHNLAAATRQE